MDPNPVRRLLRLLAKDDEKVVSVVPALDGLYTVVIKGERSYGAFEKTRALAKARELVDDGTVEKIEGPEEEDEDAE